MSHWCNAQGPKDQGTPRRFWHALQSRHIVGTVKVLPNPVGCTPLYPGIAGGTMVGRCGEFGVAWFPTEWRTRNLLGAQNYRWKVRIALTPTSTGCQENWTSYTLFTVSNEYTVVHQSSPKPEGHGDSAKPKVPNHQTVSDLWWLRSLIHLPGSVDTWRLSACQLMAIHVLNHLGCINQSPLCSNFGIHSLKLK